MASVLVAIRDLLIGLALAWVGITIERPAQRANERPAVCETAGSAACEALETVNREQHR